MENKTKLNENLLVVEPGHTYELDKSIQTQEVPLLKFQNGAVPDVGRNGFQNEEVLEALIDRLTYLNGLFPCRENSVTITKLEEALMWQERRTANRKKRGVEGKHVK